MFMTKKKKIKAYLEALDAGRKSGFDRLLEDYLGGELVERLAALGVTKADIHIDWFDDIKCIGVQGRYKKYYMDLQIYPEEFCVSFDLDEPDNDTVHALTDKEQVYRVLSDAIQGLQDAIS